MGNCSNCGAKTGFLSGNSTTTCDAEDCENEGCDQCKRIKECPDCGGNYCEKHFAPNKHNCDGGEDEEEESDEETQEPEEGEDYEINYVGKNKELAYMDTDMLDIEVHLKVILMMEKKGYVVVSRDYKTGDCLVFRKISAERQFKSDLEPLFG